MRKIDDQRNTGTDPSDRQRTCRSSGAWVCFQLRRTINMALLTELFQMAGLTLVVCLLGVWQVRADNSTGFGPYKGPVVHGVDTTTLTGKVMCGYQGWFGAAGDNTNGSGGWRHWCRYKGPPSDTNITVDLWPDVSELDPDERFATDFMLDGKQADVFSSLKKATVLRHFQWMKDYGLDGVFVQRFINGLAWDPRELQRRNTVLAHCRDGANRYGRAYAVMYDLTGLRRGRINEVMEDWRALRKNLTITDDPAYLHHRGRPVVAVWGIGFNDGRDYTLAECRQLVEFLKGDSEAGGCTVSPIRTCWNWRVWLTLSVRGPSAATPVRSRPPNMRKRH